MVYALQAQYKPFEFRNEANNIVRYDIDVADEIGRRIGNVAAKPMDTNWATVIQSLYNGQFDVVIGGMTATEKRYARVNFSAPYMNASSGLLVKADSGIRSQKDLGGKTVGAGQRETARALGLDEWQTFWLVLAPQAIKPILPPLANEVANLVKASALLSAISLNELTKVGNDIIYENFVVIEVLIELTFAYLVIVGSMMWVARYLEARRA